MTKRILWLVVAAMIAAPASAELTGKFLCPDGTGSRVEMDAALVPIAGSAWVFLSDRHAVNLDCSESHGRRLCWSALPVMTLEGRIGGAMRTHIAEGHGCWTVGRLR